MIQILLSCSLLFLVSCGGDKVQEVTVRPLANQMKYMTREINLKAGVETKLTLQNTATMAAMVHNVVILKEGADSDAIAKAALSAENNAVVSDDVVAQTGYLKPGEQKPLHLRLRTLENMNLFVPIQVIILR